jgi:hypothetical protein
MPNWCRCQLTLKGPAFDLRRLLRRYARDDHPLSISLDKVMPIPNAPAGERWACRDVVGESNRVQLHLGERSWMQVYLETAWVPPKEIVARLGSEFPSLEVSLLYFEPGAAFGGCFAMEGGEVVDDSPMSIDPMIQALVDAGLIPRRMGALAALAVEGA